MFRSLKRTRIACGRPRDTAAAWSRSAESRSRRWAERFSSHWRTSTPLWKQGASRYRRSGRCSGRRPTSVARSSWRAAGPSASGFISPRHSRTRSRRAGRCFRSSIRSRHLVTQAVWQGTLFPDAGEASILRIARVRRPVAVSSPRERDLRREARSRAERNARRFAVAYQLRSFVTLTYATAELDESRVRRDIRRFLRIVQRRGKIPWLFVIEPHQRHGLHVHLLIPARTQRSELRRAWGMGHVNRKLLCDNGDVRRTVAYLMKSHSEPKRHSYDRAKGFPLLVRRVRSSIEEGVRSGLARLMGCEPNEVDSSEDWPGWRGPPVRRLRWDDI